MSSTTHTHSGFLIHLENCVKLYISDNKIDVSFVPALIKNKINLDAYKEIICDYNILLSEIYKQFEQKSYNCIIGYGLSVLPLYWYNAQNFPFSLMMVGSIFMLKSLYDAYVKNTEINRITNEINSRLVNYNLELIYHNSSFMIRVVN